MNLLLKPIFHYITKLGQEKKAANSTHIAFDIIVPNGSARMHDQKPILHQTIQIKPKAMQCRSIRKE